MKLVILDRDGVINRDSAEFIKSPEEWVPLPGSLSAIARLTRAGYRVVVATNQSGVGRGLLGADALDRIHRRMLEAVRAAGGEIAGVYFCPHVPEDRCACRKPAPGLFHAIARAFGADLRRAWAVGDSARDLEAARSAGARPVLVLTGNGKATLDGLPATHDVRVHADLAEFTDALLAEPEPDAAGPP